jgi:hypothetical protein
LLLPLIFVIVGHNCFFLINFDGAMVRVLASNAVDIGFYQRLGKKGGLHLLDSLAPSIKA